MNISWFKKGAIATNVAIAPFLVLTAAFFFLSSASAEDNPVTVESLSTSTAPAPVESPRMVPFEPVIDEEGNAQPDGIETQYQMQLLQQEVMDLRGLVESLQNEINRMKATQEDRYLELDRRFQNLGTVAPVTTETPVPSTGETGETPLPATGEVATEDEKSLYDTALELIRNRQYDMAITQLEAVITSFPDGTYAPNAYYWIGEVHAAKPEPDYEAARQALAQVISFFPEHQKVPDAAFKLGKVYHLMGDCDRATELLTQVIEQHQGKSVGKLAESYLRDKVSCDNP